MGPKPTYTYIVWLEEPEIGKEAYLIGTNRPAQKPLSITSYVMAYDADSGRIETENSIYVRTPIH